MYVISKTGAWDIQNKDEMLPVLEIALAADDTRDLLKVTCQFFARTMTDDLNDGFQYIVTETTNKTLAAITPVMGMVQGSDSWQLYTVTVLFQLPDTPPKQPLQITLTTQAGGMNGRGSLMNLVLFGELTTLSWLG